VDEASQVTLERALPILFLGKKCIISGDKQQLQPSDFFQSKLIEEYEETYSKDDDEYLENSLSEIEDSGSLLEFVEKKYINKMLNYHYRSSRRELIQFSNVVFYNGKLIIASEPKDNVPGIEVINVKGVWDGKTNQKEADEIVKLVKKIISKEKHGSIGIVTFNINQKDLIEDMINNSNDYKIENELNRKKENGEDDSLFVKNLENVQGDERDIIIFSVTYARDSSGIFRNAFGPINKPGGKNRINVAISRSKEKMYIFKSINSGLIQRQGNDGRQIFHDYIEYVELFEKKPDLESNEIKNLFSKYLNENENINISALENQFDSPFEEEVFMEISKKIDNKKFKVISQFKQSGYIIDLVIKNIKSGEFLLAIECDGHSYHYANMTQKERDYYRQKYLEDRG
jgi:superfamily I DNA and/or RNA helicase